MKDAPCICFSSGCSSKSRGGGMLGDGRRCSPSTCTLLCSCHHRSPRGLFTSGRTETPDLVTLHCPLLPARDSHRSLGLCKCHSSRCPYMEPCFEMYNEMLFGKTFPRRFTTTLDEPPFPPAGLTLGFPRGTSFSLSSCSGNIYLRGRSRASVP